MTIEIRILQIEDVADDAELILFHLKQAGYSIVAQRVETEAELRQTLAHFAPDIILSDFSLPKLDAMSALKIARDTAPDVPFLFISGTLGEQHAVAALKAGAIDYVIKGQLARLPSAVDRALYETRQTALHRRKNQEERRMQKLFADIVNLVPLPLMLLDAGRQIQLINPAFTRAFGWSIADLAGHDIRQIMPPDDADRIIPSIERRYKDNDADGLEGFIMTKGGAHLRAAIQSGEDRPLPGGAASVDDDETAHGVVIVIRDITEEKKRQRQLELADRLTSLGTLAAGVAHEVSTPLCVVAANSEFVAERLKQVRASYPAQASPELSEQRLDAMIEAVGDIRSSASRMARIISDLRGFTNPTEQASQIIDLVPCVEWAIRATASQFLNQVELVTQYGEIPPVRADEMRMGQIIVNLLVNAIQAFPAAGAHGGKVTVVTLTDDQGRAVVEVQDTGSGIPKEALKKIYDPFFTTKPVGVGTGLGLSICHGIVSSFGGEIQVLSELGKGTTFRVVLPPACPEERELRTADTSEGAESLVGRILIVDDDDGMARMMERQLVGGGHEVVSAKDPVEGLALIDGGGRFDAILSDMMMPKMTGMEFYETLTRRNPDLAGRIIFVTGGAVTSQTHAFLQSVPNRRIQKPFRFAKLNEQLRLLLADERRISPTARPASSEMR